MVFELISVPAELYVEGQSDTGAVGGFRGRVLAIGLRGSDPIASASPEGAEGTVEPEGLLGWGTTHFLVADEDKPAPVWVQKNDITSHRVGSRETANP